MYRKKYHDSVVTLTTRLYIIRTHLIIGANVKSDGQALVWLDAGQGRVQGELADGYAHALGSKVTEAEDALAVGDDDGSHVVLGPVFQHVVDVALVVDADEEATGPAEYQAELLAGQTDRRRVDQGHHLLHVLAQQLVEELLVAVLMMKVDKLKS